MVVIRILAVVAAAFAVAVVNAPSAAAQPATQTLTIGTNGSPDAATVVSYTCVELGQICGPATAPPGRWSQTMVVPRGTMVYLHARWDRVPAAPGQDAAPADPAARPDCWIKDAAGNILASGVGTCIYQAPRGPLPAAPPSDS